MRLILDANVFVSAAISHQGACGQVLLSVLANSDVFELIATEKIIVEIVQSLCKPRVLRYSRKTIKESIAWMENISSIATIVPDIAISFDECRDPDDVVYLAAADVSKASFIVSGDKDLLVLKRYKEAEIVSPSNFLFASRQMLLT